MAQPDVAAVAPSRELEPRERVDGHSVRLYAADVAQGDVGAAALEERADALAQAGEVAARDRPADGEGDRARPWP